MQYWLPKAISDQDLDLLETRLDLSEAQALFFRQQVFPEYSIEAQKLFSEFRPQIDRLSILAFQASTPTCQPEYLELVTEFVAGQKEYYQRLVSLDSLLFDQLLVVLAETQLPNLELVRLRRKSECCDLHSYSIPLAQIHIAKLFDNIIGNDQARLAALSILREYDVAATPLHVSIQRAMFDGLLAVHQLTFAMQQLKREQPGFERRLDELLVQRSAHLARQGRLQGQLADLNRQFLKRICEVLPQAEREYFERTVKEQAYYRIVHPDSLSPMPLYEKLAAAPNLPVEVQAAMQALLDEFQTSHAAVSAEMELHYDKWREHFASTWASEGYNSYALTMRKLREKRWRLDHKLIDECLGILPYEAKVALQPLIDEYLGNFQKTFDAAQGDSFPGV